MTTSELSASAARAASTTISQRVHVGFPPNVGRNPRPTDNGNTEFHSRGCASPHRDNNVRHAVRVAVDCAR
jgi:hypothetical protein